MKKLLSLLLVLVTLFSLVACGEPQPKDFTCQGMTITLTDAFKENTQGGYTVCYETATVAVFVLKEAFTLQAGLGDKTVEEYAAMVKQSNAARNPSDISTENGLVSMEYSFTNESTGDTYKYFSTMFKGSDAFWLVQFACKEASYDANKSDFIGWAKSVTFA